MAGQERDMLMQSPGPKDKTNITNTEALHFTEYTIKEPERDMLM